MKRLQLAQAQQRREERSGEEMHAGLGTQRLGTKLQRMPCYTASWNP